MAVIYGESLSVEDFNTQTPWLVRVTTDNGFYSGIMVAPNWVLTVDWHENGRARKVRLGSPDYQQAQEFDVVEILDGTSPPFVPTYYVRTVPDITLLRISGSYSGPVPILPIAQIQLQHPFEDPLVSDELWKIDFARIAGWGRTENQQQPIVASQGWVMRSRYPATDRFGSKSPFFVDALPSPSEMGEGDQGGAVFIVNPDQTTTLLGIMSRVQDSVGVVHTIYTRASTIRDWLIYHADIRPPIVVANPVPNQTARYQWEFSYVVPANVFSHPDPNMGMSYGATGLPPGLHFDSATRTISGLPTAAGDYNVTLMATDYDSPPRKATANFTITVQTAAMEVTAGGYSRLSGQPNPIFTVKVKVVLGGDHIATRQWVSDFFTRNNLSANYSCPATQASPPGSYTITPTVSDPNGVLANFNVTYKSGTLTVVAPTATCEPNNASVWWRFDEDLNDSLGGNNGTEHGEMDFLSELGIQSVSLGGTDGYVTVPYSAALMPGEVSYTLEGRFRTTAAGTIFSFNECSGGGDCPASAIGVSVSPIGEPPELKLYAYLRSSQTGQAGDPYTGQELDGSRNVADGQWHHFALVRDMAAQTNILYLDGTEEVNVAMNPGSSRRISADTTFQPPVLIGAYLGTGTTTPSLFFAGEIDNVVVYHRALSSAEVNARAIGNCLTPPSITCPANIVEQTSDPQGKVVNFSPSASSPNGNVTIICTPPSGFKFPASTTTVNCTATDTAGQSASCSFNVTVNYSGEPCPPLSGAVTWWRFDGNLNDSFGTNVGAPNGGVSYVAGLNNQAINLNGTDGYVVLPYSDSLMPGNDSFTLEGWFHTTADGTIFSFNECSDGGECRSGNIGVATWQSKLQGYLRSSDTGQDGDGYVGQELDGSRVAADGQWHHFALVRNVEAQTNILYLDGTEDISAAADLGTLRRISDTGGLQPRVLIGAYLGTGSATPSDLFNGAVENLVVYHRALTSAEVYTRYRSGLTGNCDPIGTPTITCPANITEQSSAPSGKPVTFADPTASSPNGNVTVVCTPASGSVFPVGTTTVNCTATDSANQTAMCSFTVTVNYSPAGTCAQPPGGLIGWWRGENNALDTANGNHGTLQNGAVYAPGRVGSAFSLDGVDDFVEIADSPSLNTPNGITVMGWIRRDGGGGAIASKWDSFADERSWALILIGAGQLRFTLSTIGNSDTVATVVSNGVLTHVAATYDVASLSMKIYVNGVEVPTTGPAPVPGATIQDSAAPLWLGKRRDGDGSQDFFGGLLDDMDLYSRALGSNEIAAIYAAGSAGKCVQTCTPPPSGLVSWWRGENNAIDEQGVNNGSIQGGVNFVPGKVGSAFHFDGSTGLVALGGNSSFRKSVAITYSFWARIPADGGGYAMGAGAVLGHGYGGVGVYPNSLVFSWTPTSPLGDTFIASENASIPTNEWAHLSVVVDFVNQTRAMYINGQSVATTLSQVPSDWTPVSSYNAGQTDFFGGRFVNAQEYFKGDLDEVDVYDRALTPSEVLAIYEAGAAGKCIAQPLALSPTDASIIPANTVTFTATGGRPPYSFVIATNNSGGDINPTNGLYTAGATLNATDIIVVTDNLGARATGAVSVTACHLNSSGMLGWWRGENDAMDSRGANHGTLRNGANFTTGLVGTAFQFDGVDDHVEIPSAPTVQPQQALTIEGWVYAQGEPNLQAGIAGTWDDLTGSYRTYLFWVWNRHLELLISPDGGSYPRATDPDVFPTNQWVHVAGTYDGDTISVYRNGVLVGSSSYPGGIAINSHPLFIGRTDSGSNGSDYWKGAIDELSLYDRALSPAELAAIYQAGAAGKCSSGALALSPSAISISTTGTVQFIASAGLPPYAFSIVGPTNHGNINPVTGRYLATNHCGVSQTIRATDAAGHTADAVVQIVDSGPPSIVCPADATVAADGNGIAPVPDFVASTAATDDCGTPTVSQSPPAGTPLTVGQHTITLIATDNTGESSLCNVILTVLPQPVFTLSGIITNIPSGTPLAGAIVILSYEANGQRTQRTSTTDANGSYSFSGIPIGASGLWLPQLEGFVFTPVKRSFTDLQANRVGEFGASQSLTISGRISDPSGLGLGGVEVKLSGTRNTKITTSASGSYVFKGLPPGNYQVSPTNSPFLFTPPVASFAGLAADANTNFTGTPTNNPGGRIAFSIPVSSDQPFVFERTSVMNADGTQRALLGKPGQRHTDQAWSPDGSQLALVRNSRVVVLNADGSAERVVSGPDLICFSPTWSPDAAKLAFGAYAAKVPGIYVVNANGTQRVRLPVTDPLPLQVSWSPDGTQLAFTRLQNGNQVWTIHPDGTGLTATTFTFSSRLGKPGKVKWPVWSPNGGELAFLEPSSEEAYVGSSLGGTAHLAWPGPLLPMREPGWSPDGGMLSFYAPKPIGNVMLMGTNGHNLHALAPGLASQQGWGRQVARTTTTGTNVSATMGAIAVNFSNVIASGATVINPIAPDAVPLPSGFFTVVDSIGYEISTTAAIDGPITITFRVPQIYNPRRFAQLRVLHGELDPGTGQIVMVDRTILAPDAPAPEFATRSISARVSSLSPFIIGEIASTDSPQITGFILDTNGLPVENVAVELGGNELASATSQSDGSFAFFNLETNGFYTITPQLTGLRFDPPSLSLSNVTTNGAVFFVAEPESAVTPPTLRLVLDERFGGQPALVWPAAPTDFVLEASPSLSSTNWQPVVEQPLEMGSETVQPIEFSAESRFFRLRSR